MTYEATMLARLSDGAMPGEIGTTIGALKVAFADLERAGELVPAMTGVANVILAAEAVEAEAERIKEQARKALAYVMSDTGCTSLKLAYHTVSVRDATRTAIVTDAKALPDEFIRIPEPAPDKTKIAKALREGRDIPGATLSNGGDAVVTFTARKL